MSAPQGGSWTAILEGTDRWHLCQLSICHTSYFSMLFLDTVLA